MKKLFALLAVAIGVVACQKDQADFGVNLGGEQETTINVSLPEETRANSALSGLDNGVRSDHDLRFILEIYNGTECVRDVKIVKDVNITSASFNVRLVPGHEYDFVVWADFVKNEADTYFDTSAGLDQIKMTNLNAMTEARDAYYGVVKNATVSAVRNITLKRPFAKIRVIADDVDAAKAVLHKKLTAATVTYSDVTIYNTFDARNKVVSGDAAKVKNITYPSVYDESNPSVYNESNLYVDYLLVPQDGQSIVKFSLNVADFVNKDFLTDIAVEANKLTTIKGDILTNGSDIKVEINDNLAAETIYLEGNVTLTEDLNVNRPLVVAAGKTAVLNLNGKKIINTNLSENYGEGEGIVVYGNLTIEGEGTIQGTSMAVWARGGNGNAVVTIKGGTFVGCGADLEGGRSVVYASSGNVVNIYGGEFKAEAADETSFATTQYPVLNVADNNGMINVYGGRFYKQNPAAPGTEPAAWNATHPNGFLADGYISVANGEWFDVMKGAAVANINDFNTALSNAENAAINVTNDVDFGTTNSISVERDVILNFNDNDVVAGGGTTKNSSIDVFGDYTVTVNDANITGGSIMAYYGADVVLNNVELTYNWYQSGRNMIYAASDNDKQVVTVINGGYYDMTGGSGNRYVCAHGNAIVYVNGGTFTGKGPGATYAPFDAINIGSYTARIIISGGTFDFDPSKDYIGSGNTAYPPTATIADGYKVVNNGNGTWSVVKQ